MSRSTWIIIAVVVVVLAVIALLVIRRRRYVKDLQGRGWTFVSSPTLESVLEHQAPPFGLGFKRSVDESISGTTHSGVRFHVFEYACRDGGPPFDERVASLALPLALPGLFITEGPPRSGVNLAPVDIDPAWQVRAAGSDYAHAVLTDGVRAAITSFAAVAGQVDLSIDGDHLVAVGPPKDPDDLETFLEAMAPIATAIDPSQLAGYAVARQPATFGFYGRPDWVLVDRDDSLIDKYGLTTVGSHHKTERIIRSPNDGLPLEAFIHRWQTTHTETSTDSDGHTHTRTVTDHHDETVTAVWLPFQLPQLSINGGWGGQRVRFELEEFNQGFAVRCESPRFASDVIHPRMMEYLMRAQPPGFRIEGQLIRFEPAAHDTLLIGQCADFAHEFLARIPTFVWRDLQVTPPPFRSTVSTAAS
jgi:hypothetical protein